MGSPKSNVESGLPLLINWHMNIWHIHTSGYIWVNLQPAVHDFESKLHRIPDPSSPRVGPPSSICLWVCSGPSRHLYSTHPGAKQREKGCCPDAAGLSDCYQWESPKYWFFSMWRWFVEAIYGDDWGMVSACLFTTWKKRLLNTDCWSCSLWWCLKIVVICWFLPTKPRISLIFRQTNIQQILTSEAFPSEYPSFFYLYIYINNSNKIKIINT